MSEVSTWNATDNANTAVPPDGWPEGMQPSAVNDSARMMMGALRREHDRISAQIGSVAGTISTTTINATTISTTGAITASGPITGTAINSTGNASVAGTLTAGGVSTGNITASGTVTAAQLTSTGSIFANNNINAAGAIGASGNINGAAIGASGNIVAGGTVQGAYVYSTGNMDCAGNIDTPNTVYSGAVVIPNQASYYARDTGGTPQSLLAMGNNNWCLLSTGAATVTTNAQFAQNNQLYCLSNGAYYCGLSAFAWAGVISYSFPAPSDRRQKTDIQELPDDCLALVRAIQPKRYRWREGVNALDPKRTHWGFIAQEIGEAFATAGLDFGGHQVGDDDDKTETLDTNELVSVLWGAVRELSARLAALETGGTHV